MPVARHSRTRPSAPPADHDEITTTIDSLRRIVRALRLAEQQSRARTGISAPQLFVLRQLQDAEALSVGEIAARALTDRTSAGAVVRRLADGGFVTATPDERDRRRTTVRITRRGATILRRAPAPPTEILVRGLDALGVRTRRGLAESLSELVAAMGLEKGRAPMLFEEQDAGAPSRRRPRDG